MPVLVTGIHVFSRRAKVVDGRAKPGHDPLRAIRFKRMRLWCAPLDRFVPPLSRVASQ